MEVLSKKCIKCDKTKPIERFKLRTDTGKYRGTCKDCQNEQSRNRGSYRKWAAKNKKHLKQYMKYYDIKRHYGLTKEEYDDMIKRTGGKCEICGSKEKLHIDHCHKSGPVRGLLCRSCNHGLGNFKDSIENLEAAIAYLTNFAEAH